MGAPNMPRHQYSGNSLPSRHSPFHEQGIAGGYELHGINAEPPVSPATEMHGESIAPGSIIDRSHRGSTVSEVSGINLRTPPGAYARPNYNAHLENPREDLER